MLANANHVNHGNQATSTVPCRHSFILNPTILTGNARVPLHQRPSGPAFGRLLRTNSTRPRRTCDAGVLLALSVVVGEFSMSRAVPYRTSPPPLVAERMEEAVQASMYLVQEPGPTSFVVRHDSPAASEAAGMLYPFFVSSPRRLC